MAFHPLGTARAGADPAQSVVDGDLAASTASPASTCATARWSRSALGVNPQITIMALATRPGLRAARRRAAGRAGAGAHGGAPAGDAGPGVAQLPSARMIPRADAIEALIADPFDVVVIGGGITGAGVALDAASRGYSVALLEKSDFAAGTSSRSTSSSTAGCATSSSSTSDWSARPCSSASLWSRWPHTSSAR